jgi:large subunit ribosomal protein L4
MNKKEKRIALKSALTSRVEDGKLIVLDELKFDEIKTRQFQAVLDNLKITKALIVISENDEKVVMSARNIPKVKTAQPNTINVYDIMRGDTLVLTKDALAIIEEVYA